jgi:hypothetical protein
MLDTFTLAIFLLMVMIAINQGLTWAAAGLMLLLVLTMHNKALLALAVIGILAGFWLGAASQALWVLVAVVVVAAFAFKTGGGPEAYSPEAMFGGY